MSQVDELAKSCGVTVQTVRRWCAKHEVKKVGKRYELTEEQVENFRARYSTSKRNNGTEHKGKGTEQNELCSHLLEEVEGLKQQLAVKDEQIRALSDSLSNLTEQNNKLLDANKALSAATAMHTAADKKDALMVEPQPAYEVPQKKPSRLQRLLAAWRG